MGNLQNEVDLLRKIQHPNVISLLGCSSQGVERFIVYELMQNGSLETQLHGMASVYFFKDGLNVNLNWVLLGHTLIIYF